MVRWEDSTLVDAVEEVADGRRDAPALRFEGDDVTYGELIDAGTRFGRGIADLGHGQGEPAAVWLPNRPEWLSAHLGFSTVGAPVVAVNTRYRTGELEYMLSDSRSTTLVLQPGMLTRDLLSMLLEVCPAVDEVAPDELGDATDFALERVVVLDPDGDADLPSAAVRFADVMERGETAPDPGVAVTADDPCAVFYTSGTTSKPKGVIHDHVSVANHPYYMGRWFGIGGDDVALSVMPICGVAGFDFTWSALLSGATAVLHSHFDPEAAARAIEEAGVTYFVGVGEMYDAIVATDRDLTSLRRASIYLTDEDQMRDIEERTGCPIVQPYGLSEAHSHVCVSRPTAPVEERVLPGGPPIHGEIEFAVRDPDTGEDLVGEPGELRVRGYSRMKEYLGKPERTAEEIDDGGWLATGDLCEIDERGHVRYYSRIGDMLRLRGFRVAPQEIEAAIDDHPDVDLAQVVGARDEEMAEVPVAFVRLAEGGDVTAGGLRDFLNERVADFKVPREFVFVDEFPVTESPNGTKIQRNELADRAADLVGAGERGAG